MADLVSHAPINRESCRAAFRQAEEVVGLAAVERNTGIFASYRQPSPAESNAAASLTGCGPISHIDTITDCPGPGHGLAQLCMKMRRGQDSTWLEAIY